MSILIKYPWLYRVLGAIYFVGAPVLLPIYLMYDHQDEVKAYFKDCWRCITKGN